MTCMFMHSECIKFLYTFLAYTLMFRFEITNVF